MKKNYIQPETVVLCLQTEGVIAASIGTSETGVGGSNAWSNKKESSIWGTEEEENKGGYW